MPSPDAPPSKLDAETFQRLHPRIYFERFLAEGIRPDGREIGSWRNVSVNVGSISTAHGSALVRLGDTTIVCGVKAEIAQPDVDRPEHGFIVPNLDLPAICSPKFKPGPPGEEAQTLSERLHQILTSTQVIPTTSLCIHSGKSAWVLYVDATCINYDGNALDATLIAVIAALRNTRLPVARFEEETGRTLCSRTETRPLEIARMPLCMSFGLFASTNLLPDLSAYEEPLASSTLEIVIDEIGEICNISQVGVASIPGQDVTGICIKVAKERRVVLGGILDSS